MRRIGPTPVNTVTVATSDFSQLVAANLNRVYLEVINDTASTIYIASSATEPTDIDSTTNGMQKLLAGERKIWEEPSVITTSAIFVYQTSGGDLKIKYCEGV